MHRLPVFSPGYLILIIPFFFLTVWVSFGRATHSSLHNFGFIRSPRYCIVLSFHHDRRATHTRVGRWAFSPTICLSTQSHLFEFSCDFNRLVSSRTIYASGRTCFRIEYVSILATLLGGSLTPNAEFSGILRSSLPPHIPYMGSKRPYPNWGAASTKRQVYGGF